MTCDEIRENLDIYALGALDGGDLREVASHLATCADCRAEAQRAEKAVAYLAFAAPPAPRVSADLKTRVLAAAHNERTPQARPSSGAPARRPRLSFRWPSFRLAPAAALASLVIALGVFAWALSLQGRLERQASEIAQLQVRSQQYREMTDLLTTPGLIERVMAATDTAPRATALMYLVPSGTKACLLARDLPTLPSNQAYQLWLIDASGQRTSGGVFRARSDGSAWLVFDAPRPLSTFAAAGVTIEPAGGSPGPTGARVLGGNL